MVFIFFCHSLKKKKIHGDDMSDIVFKPMGPDSIRRAFLHTNDFETEKKVMGFPYLFLMKLRL